MARPKLTDEQKRQNRIDRLYKLPDVAGDIPSGTFAALTLGSCKTMVAKAFQELRRLECATRLGYVTCCSCGEVRQWNDNMDGGHFVSRTCTWTLYDARNVNGQCKQCNGGTSKNNAAAGYERFMLSTHGQAVVDELRALKDRPPYQFTKLELAESLVEYRVRIKAEKQRIGC